MREAFAVQKLLTIFQQKYWRISDMNILNFNDTLTNDVFSFEQLGPEVYVYSLAYSTALVPNAGSNYVYLIGIFIK